MCYYDLFIFNKVGIYLINKFNRGLKVMFNIICYKISNLIKKAENQS